MPEFLTLDFDIELVHIGGKYRSAGGSPNEIFQFVANFDKYAKMEVRSSMKEPCRAVLVCKLRVEDHEGPEWDKIASVKALLDGLYARGWGASTSGVRYEYRPETWQYDNFAIDPSSGMAQPGIITSDAMKLNYKDLLKNAGVI